MLYTKEDIKKNILSRLKIAIGNEYIKSLFIEVFWNLKLVQLIKLKLKIKFVR